MELFKLLSPAAVRVVGQLPSKKRLFQELGELAAQAYGLVAAAAVESLAEKRSSSEVPNTLVPAFRSTAAPCSVGSMPTWNTV